MRSMERFSCFKKRLFFRTERRWLRLCGFTLLEVMVSLLLIGIFITLLTKCLYQVIQFVGAAGERTRQRQEMRTFYEFLTADCERLFIPLQTGESPKLNFSTESHGDFSLVLLRQLFGGWEHSLVAQYGESGICAVQYRFHLKTGIISRHLYGGGGAHSTTLTHLAHRGGDRSIVEAALSQQDVITSRNLVHHVVQFELYPIDIRGRRQAQWISGNSVGLEYCVTFRSLHQQIQQKFHARIPVFKGVEGAYRFESNLDML